MNGLLDKNACSNSSFLIIYARSFCSGALNKLPIDTFLSQMNHYNEKEVVQKILDNDPKAIEIIIDVYLERIRQIVFHKLGRSNEKIEDIKDMSMEIVWEVIVKIQSGNFDHEKGTLSQYIYGIINNTCKNYFKQQKRLQMKRFSDHITMEDQDPNQNLDNILSMLHFKDAQLSERDREIANIIEHALRQLDEKHRKLVYLKYFKKMSYEEIGVSENIEIKKVKSRLFEARKRLESLISNLLNRFPNI